MKKLITLDCFWVTGYLKDGHFELEIDDEDEYEEFQTLSKADQLKYIINEGKLLIDSYSVEDYETANDFSMFNIV